MNDIYDIIMPVVLQDLKTINYSYSYLRKYIKFDKLVLIGNETLAKEISKLFDQSVVFIDEDSLVEYSNVENIIAQRCGENVTALRRTGWYLQQFLKMAYSEVCEKEYYLIWDSDTIPLKKLKMLDEGHPIFHMKEEYCKAYFETMERLLPGLKKIVNNSFISEHMLINCNIMRELICNISNNDLLKGETFYEKIINAISENDIALSGFSEFETYGTYCVNYYPNFYVNKKWNSLREGNVFFEISQFSTREAEWLAKWYDAVSFEKSMKKNHGIGILRNRVVQRTIRFDVLKRLLNLINEVLYYFFRI